MWTVSYLHGAGGPSQCRVERPFDDAAAAREFISVNALVARLPGCRLLDPDGNEVLQAGQTLHAPSTGALFRVIETSSDGTAAIAEGARTRGRVYVGRDDRGGWYMRSVSDSGACGTLLETLAPYGARRTLRRPR